MYSLEHIVKLINLKVRSIIFHLIDHPTLQEVSRTSISGVLYLKSYCHCLLNRMPGSEDNSIMETAQGYCVHPLIVWSRIHSAIYLPIYMYVV